MIVTAHQPNFLPGLSVMEKVRVSDVVVWCDEFQYSHGGFTNRNRCGEGWLTVPVVQGSSGQPINQVRIGSPPVAAWRERMRERIREAWDGEAVEELCVEVKRPYRLLVGLNVACLQILCRALELQARWVFQSHLDGGHAVPGVSDDPAELVPASERLAMMVEEVGGTVYLSGPSGRNYLDEGPFERRGIRVEYFQWDGPNPSAASLLPPH